MKENFYLLKVLFGLFVHFLMFWSIRILAYICVRYSNEKTYFVLLIEEYFSWKVEKHLWKDDVSTVEQKISLTTGRNSF